MAERTPSQTVGPFLHIGLAPAALTAETAPWPIEDYRFHSRVEHEIACNWKTYVDNYAEGYHVSSIHPGLDRQIDSKQYEVILKNRHVVHRGDQDLVECFVHIATIAPCGCERQSRCERQTIRICRPRVPILYQRISSVNARL